MWKAPLHRRHGRGRIAAAATVLTAPAGKVDASPLPRRSHRHESCAQRPWPYLHCVGTPFSNPRVRLVSTDRLAGNRTLALDPRLEAAAQLCEEGGGNGEAAAVSHTCETMPHTIMTKWKDAINGKR